MSQTSGEELLNRINATLGVLQDAQEEAVEAVRDVAVHKADPQAHGEIIAAAVEAAVSEALGGASGGGSAGEDGGQLAARLSTLEARFDADGTVLAQHLPLTDAVNSATGTLAASDTAVKTLNDRLNGLSSSPADSRLWIGVPRFWRSTTLPPNHCWANGDFVAFADWPELAQVYEDGGFEGMLLPWDADGDTQDANLGQWRPDAAEPTGLFTPNLTGQFFRIWGPGADKAAGAWGRDEIRNITGVLNNLFSSADSAPSMSGAFRLTSSSRPYRGNQAAQSGTSLWISFAAANVVPTGVQNVPQHVWQPVILYLGQPATSEEAA